ncbi:MAG: hypothetical protein J5787_02300 [Alphaproteobacteria bacterium]|nr:hypothetical protein [Alphaproteobacteria bacterium]
MSIFNKIKKAVTATGLVLIFSASQAKAGDCMPVNPICLFKMLLQASPGLPVFDFASIPAVIPHLPAALLKEGQAKLKEIADDGLEKIRSGQLPSLADIKISTPDFGGSVPPANTEYSSLAPFPNIDGDTPEEIAKAVEVIFLRPGWRDGDAPMSVYDLAVMEYYAKKFAYINTLEVLGFAEYMQNKIKEFAAAAEDIQKQVEHADDENKAQRANYAAHLLEYQLMIVQNQLTAATLQLRTANDLERGYILSRPIFGNM